MVADVSRELEGKGRRESRTAGIQEGGTGTHVGSMGTAGIVRVDIQPKKRNAQAAGRKAGGEHGESGDRDRPLQQGLVCAGLRESRAEPSLKP